MQTDIQTSLLAGAIPFETNNAIEVAEVEWQ